MKRTGVEHALSECTENTHRIGGLLRQAAFALPSTAVKSHDMTTPWAGSMQVRQPAVWLQCRWHDACCTHTHCHCDPRPVAKRVTVDVRRDWMEVADATVLNQYKNETTVS